MRLRRRRAESTRDNLCLLPWLNLSLDVDGAARPCCKFDHVDQVGGAPLHGLAEGGLAGAWNSPGMVALREEFRDGGRPVACASCWAEEDAGVPSFRQVFLRDRRVTPEADVEDLTPSRPHSLDLKLSNTCNLACRICGPVASSKWLTEELVAVPAPRPPGTFVAHLADTRRQLAANQITDDPEERARLVAWAPAIEHLELTGGEPMLSKESGDVLELLVDHGQPERTTLQITTNATLIDPRIVSRLDRFREVTISLSVDDMGPRLEYQRHPARWDEVRANIDRYAELASPTCQVFLNATISAFNVWDLPEYLWWWRQNVADHSIGFHPNLLHSPRSMCTQCLPEPIKARLRPHWSGHPAWHDEATRAVLDEILSFTESAPTDPDSWPEFIRTTREIDARRGQHFDDVFPTFVAELRAVAAWDEAPTAPR
ncbi:MAG: twitch domain-containing radical SAM protein [Iamia sp.]